jgi:acyl-coenzyme A synthetase/AMP-(fatty) acid ligase
MRDLALPFSPWLTEADAARPCLMDDASGEWLTYGAVKGRAAAYAEALAGPKALVFLYAHNDVASVSAFLGALAAGHAVALLDPKLAKAPRAALAEAYRPDFVIDVREKPEPVLLSDGNEATLHPDLAILLSTSGSTGSPKFVRLALAAVEANARSIAEALEIVEDDVAASHLPLHYSFGMSTLTGHFSKGARIRLTDMGFMDRAFWGAMKDAGVTHLPGVPFHFQALQKLRYERLRLPNLKSLAQAGGFLDVPARQAAHDYMSQRGGRFYVMYGQTEAAPRMTTLPHDHFPAAPGSVGVPLSGGRLEILSPDENGHGEVVFHGPNVMMGYAESRADLTKGDEHFGRLLTGDIGFLDDAGRLTLTGRSKRFGKVYGLRVNLDEIEKLANTVCEAAVTQSGDGLHIHFATTGDAEADEHLKQTLFARFTERYSIPCNGYRIHPIDAIPRTERGKIDYKAIEVAS